MGTLIYEDDSGEEHVIVSSPHLDWRSLEIASSALLHYSSSMDDGTERRSRRIGVARWLGGLLKQRVLPIAGVDKMSKADEKRRDEFLAARTRRAESADWQ